MPDIDKAVSFMEMIAADDSHGYSQDKRGGNPDYDCSSLVGTALNYAGFDVFPLSTTNTLYSQLIKCGFKEIGINDARKRGDIFLTPGSHVIMCTDSDYIVHASINELNKTTGGTAGDQTGSEITKRAFYYHKNGWKYHLRYEQSSIVKAIDISKYNNITSWSALSKEINTVIIRAGYRGSTNGQIVADNKFIDHISNAQKYGMNIGIYFYDQSINEREAREQAEWCVNVSKNYKLSLPIFIDSENSSTLANGRADKISVTQRTANIKAFCNRVKEMGMKAGIYASDSWFKDRLIFSQLSNEIIWVARYSTLKPTISHYNIWQYGSEQFSWSPKPIDVNYIYDLNVNSVTKPIVNNVPNEIPVLFLGKVNTTSGSLNVRSAPDIASHVVTSLKKGDFIQIKGDLGEWYRIDMGYVSKNYIKQVIGTVINCNNLNVRKTPDTLNSSNIIKTIPVGTQFIVMAVNNNWYQILLSDGSSGFVSGKYVIIN